MCKICRIALLGALLFSFSLCARAQTPASPSVAYVTSKKNDITVHLVPQIREQSKNEIIQNIFLEKIKKHEK
jgi:hypothetical protein